MSRIHPLAMALLGATLCGCESVSYYSQAVRGQYQIVAKRERFETVLASPKTPDALKEKLRMVQRLRTFAATELHLPVAGHYDRYVDLHRRFVVWNVHAAPAYSLEPKTWWYPVVGRLKYRGYFQETAARRYAQKWEQRGFDVFVEGVPAYSTLGWFRDPVLNTFIHHPEQDLAETVFHELAHQRLFIGGDTDFDEAFATCVGQEGARRWLQAQGGAPAVDAYRAALQREAEFVRLVAESRSRLEASYRTNQAAALPHAKMEILARLQAEYSALKTRGGEYAGYDGWFAGSLNNAQLNTVTTYHRYVPAFRRLLEEHGGDLRSFYAAAGSLGALSHRERGQRLDDWPPRLPRSALIR